MGETNIAQFPPLPSGPWSGGESEWNINVCLVVFYILFPCDAFRASINHEKRLNLYEGGGGQSKL